MKKAVRPLMVLFCACVLLACSNSNSVIEEQTENPDRPFADYEVVPGDDPFTFTFKNKSTKFKSLEWRFGDDSLSVEDSPSHVYAKNGKYEVSLKATAPDGSTAKKLIVVDIDPTKFLKITAKAEGDHVKFGVEATSGTIVSAKWDFGDDDDSDELSPSHKYPAGDLFTTKVTVTTNKGSVAETNMLVSSDGGLIDVTNDFLLNTGPKFRASERFGSRWGVVADWRVNAAVRQRDGGMGGWDEWEGNSMSMESWGGEPDIINGKIQQTTLEALPAGQYFYQMIFHDFQVKNLLYNVISKADELPDVDKVEQTNPDVLGWTKFSGNGPLKQTTPFTLNEQHKVTIGFVSTFTDSDQNFKLTQVRLYQLAK